MTRTRAILAGACAAALLGIGGYLLVGHARPLSRAVAPTPAPIISSQAVATPVPTPTDAGHEGLRIKVPELGIDLLIVGGDGYNAPLYKAAHYPGTMWPGEGGRSVFYAHARTGMFGPLFGARTGEHIQIVSPNGTVRTYLVSQYFARWPVSNLAWLRPTNHEEVVLITCTTYNYNDPRIIAVGEPLFHAAPPAGDRRNGGG